MLKRRELVMLRTDENDFSGILLGRNNKLFQDKVNYSQRYLNYKPVVHQHLYLLSDEKINLGDWCYNYEGVIHYVDSFRLSLMKKDIEAGNKYLKVIATTNKSLTVQINRPQKVSNRIFKSLPQLPQDLIFLYIETWNTGETIKSILIEYECPEPVDDSHPFKKGMDKFRDKLTRLKLDMNNCIMSKEVKESWNKEELEIIINKALNDALKHGNSIGAYLVSGLPERYAPLTEESFKNKWLEDNL